MAIEGSVRVADCHPDRQYHAKGLCYACYVGGWKARNRARVRAYRNQPSSEARERKLLAKRSRHFERQYGLTLTAVDDFIAQQGGLCAICHRPPTSSPFGKRPRLVVDHDHTTGKVRGLLCTDCNAGIGYFDDDPVILRAVIEYLTSPPLLPERG